MINKSPVNLIIFSLFTVLISGLFINISSSATEGVYATPSNYVLMSSSGGSGSNLLASSNSQKFDNWDPGNNYYIDPDTYLPVTQITGINEVYHGTNDLLGNPVLAPNAGAVGSTFYGTTKALTSGNTLGGSREYYQDKFDSNFTANANGYTTSDVSIHESTFTASKSASVSADYNTVMEMYDNNFNGTTSITANSGGTVNVTLGNTTEMNTLILTVKRIQHTLTDNVYNDNGLSSYSVTEDGYTFTVPLTPYFCYVATYNSDQHKMYYRSFVRRGTFLNILVGYLDFLTNYITGSVDIAYYRWNTYWDAYYPFKSEMPKYWYAYNTDTGEYDQVNLATVFQYITWYLGQIYNDSSNVSQQMKNMTNDINTASTTFTDLNNKEQVAINQIKTGFDNFIPDLEIFGTFKAITWCSNYLQQMYVALGSYGTVIFIALLFGVCLQFIGYFRYK